MKTEFKVGDRVKVYDRHASYYGTVESFEVAGDVLLNVLSDGGVEYLLHPKQCRKIKQRQRIWVNILAKKEGEFGQWSHMQPPYMKNEWKEFIEVKK